MIGKDMTNLEIAELLRDVAASYQLRGGKTNLFRITAYQRAADAIEHASSELKDIWDEGKLEDVPGIGESIAKHLDELFRTGKSKHFDAVMDNLPPQMFSLMKVPGIGVKTAYKLVEIFKSELSQENPIRDLEKIAKAGKIAKLDGFGEDSQKAMLDSIKEVSGREVRLLLPYALELAHTIISWLKKNKAVKRADVLGSLRRQASTVGDVDIAVSSSKPISVIDHFTKYPQATRTLEKGKRTASIIVPGNKRVDLMVEKPQSYGSLLQHFTGSKHHNIALREYALKKGLSVSDYGIYLIDKNRKRRQLKKFATEKDFYNFLGMEYIPPELREDNGEIEAALDRRLPTLVETQDIKGDFQIHSDFDIETSHDLGESSMQDIIKKASSLGYEYLAFTEHNPSQRHHNDRQKIDLLKKKRKVVDDINASLVEKHKGTVVKVFNSLEIDILPNGKLPVPDAGLETLDFALVSIHSSFRQAREIMTQRVISALSHPKCRIFAHPTARKLNDREGIDLDWEKVFQFCKENNKWLEVNADPMRLDLPDFLIKEALIHGIKLTMGTDAHHTDGLDNMKYAVATARRGWAEKKNIVNTRSLKEFEKMLELNS
ncbi:hypothetical protein A3A76_03230 [Candidatus Woesebacteria bacterium RIFCSPLOWO2_01_FULL_39_23]|uniref:DNA polymerase beta n=1 Tax=Candidatus Woesebacteria bacterium RIFCSPHIGHO2_01_FULL_40_22 TaxID=1802499 RepID=A0A1F7YJE6_9BACT|nr:MAG: hypothetical protein A2141_00795 [Candidatus Woesebacteria bacterium RBG_16_40_11]OGM27474.1 MAG: hypothetical protein A2628_01630 [Candidatus Woesebacteria bacterium RIFCSPHIGHO2_01_FULL_40_22]OGM36569.1 MAG: hypothetical protein A3E41_04015 [Candidatus Woesebacteria bacterium RIFCSPHIGHO2_12_FULL_38_9]OGM62648.1 MAG: hypothetical protein A3A76_03230 [Candidatus Woesebacteria bacterium RIFCSPLOWO2_01_FULL_39_23]